jgi:predicted amidohydrolase
MAVPEIGTGKNCRVVGTGNPNSTIERMSELAVRQVARQVRCRIALGQFATGWHSPTRSVENASRVVGSAALRGADLVVLPEMCTTGFTMASAEYTEPLDGPSATALSRLAAEHQLHVLAGLATRERTGQHEQYYNSALLFNPHGEPIAHYRKQRLFGLGGEEDAYRAGHEAVIAEINGVRIAPFICYDLRFPELFRAVAADVHALVLIANWPVERRAHWDVLVQARAIENLCYFIAVNRVGDGGGVAYDGGSVAYDPWGERLAASGETDAATAEPCIVDVHADAVAQVRERYPFLRRLPRP